VDTAVHEEARSDRTEGNKCRTDHGQAVCASGEVQLREWFDGDSEEG
jgi:hypothetical protein